MAEWQEELLDRYKTEPELMELITEIGRAKQQFEERYTGATYRGDLYGFGGMRPEVCVRLYGLVREFKPQILIETGVCNGVSSAVILAALEVNKQGGLYSIDLPEHTDMDYEVGTFWHGKKGAVVPKDQQPGWLIPFRYRSRWHLTIGRSQDELPKLLSSLSHIDFFLHDSEHSYECMSFEYQLAWQHLRPGGLLVSDDISWNTAFTDFSELQSRRTNIIDRNMAFIIR